MQTKDEKATQKAAKKYFKAIKKYGLNNIEDGHGQGKKRYMMDAFYSGFYRGRDYQKHENNQEAFQDIQA